jgi:hypothetical protein
MEDQKKCHSCGQWSEWTHHTSDKCVHCGEVLDKVALEMETRKNESDSIQLKKIENSFLTIKDSDNWPMVFIKRIANIANAIFIAIMGFLVWLTTTIAG